MKKIFIWGVFFFLSGIGIPLNVFTQPVKHYTAEKGAIVGKNTGRYNNRPLYINNTNAFILTGDQPIARLVKGENIYGTFMLALERNGKGKWLQQCDQIKSIYRPGRMAFEITDKAFPELMITMEILPMANTTGMAIRAGAKGVQKGDSFVWAFGGAQWRKNQNLNWQLDVMGQPDLLTLGFTPEDCTNNQIETAGLTSFINLMDSLNQNKYFTVAGNCSSEIKPGTGDASLWGDIAAFKKSPPQHLPILRGTVDLKKEKNIFWAFEGFDQGVNADLSLTANPEKAFTDGLKRTESFQDRLKINTPDPYLNTLAQASVAAIDGAWYPPVFVHGAMLWNRPYPGWRTIFGGVMLGWHNRVKKEAGYYIGYQIKKSDKKAAMADPTRLLTIQDTASRFYGTGYINKDQGFYNMQSQFFDQIIEEWRWTSDPELEQFLRPALELHLARMCDCFDPDGDGVYESYLNVWPTDSQWYNGAGTAEETSYAYRGHRAARDMAQKANDSASVNYHTMVMENIKRGFFDKLWIKNRGYSGAYREQGGYGRLHENPWLYSIFLPVDARLTSPLQAVESVYYSEWALQNDHPPLGGRTVWTSGWVPAIWSVRERYPGDNYALALSYFQAGLANDAYDIMRGTFLNTAYAGIVPGNLGYPAAGTDFGDCKDTFLRTLVEGVFGYNPDYPNGVVNIAPQFPSGWDNASIDVPDVKIAFQRIKNIITYNIGLASPAKLDLRLPVQAQNVKSVSVDGKAVKWKLLPGIGCSIVQILLPKSAGAIVVIETVQPLAYYAPVTLEGNISDAVRLVTKDAKIVELYDPQEVLKKEKIANGIITAKLSNNKGFHSVVVKVLAGKAPQWRVFRIKINDVAGEAKYRAKFVDKIPTNSTWKTIDMSKQLNADVRTIYQQKYLSPRLNTVSLRIGTDGYSPWTFLYWNNKPPVIKLDSVQFMKKDSNHIVTQQQVLFNWNLGDRNIAFTSLWNNWPKEITVPVQKKGEAIWLLICGSTNPMQCNIANAIVRIKYADRSEDTLSLVPPINYWSLVPYMSLPSALGQMSRNDYTSAIDSFCVPKPWPETVQLGENCRAMLLNRRLKKGAILESITLETLSQEVVVGLMGISIMNPEN